MKSQLQFQKIYNKNLVKLAFLLLVFLSSTVKFLAQTQPEVVINKTSVQSTTVCNQFDVTLTITGNPNPQPQEVVLIIDRSGSMNFEDDNGNKPITYAKDAAIAFVNNFFTQNTSVDDKIALVSFSSNAIIDIPLTGSTGQSAIIAAINAIVPNGGTNTENAIEVADNLLTTTGSFDCRTNRSIILLSDGVPTSRNNNGGNTSGCADKDIETLCQTEAMQAGVNAQTTTVLGVEYDQSIFTIGLVGAIEGAEQTRAEITLTGIQNAGVFITEDNAYLQDIYDQILGQLVAAATQLPGQALVTDEIQSGFTQVGSFTSTTNFGGTINNKGTATISGQTISWDLPNVVNETVTLTYSIQANPNSCGITNSGEAIILYEDSSCNTQSTNFTNPTICVPCPIIDPVISQSGCDSIEYSSTFDSGSCGSPTSSAFSWEFFLDGNSIGTSNTQNGTFNYNGTAPFEGNLTAELTYNGNYGTCTQPSVTETSNTIIAGDEPPVIVCPGDINQNVDAGVAGAVVTFTDPVGTDNDTGAVTTQIAGPNSGDTFPIGDTIVTFQVEDTCNNIVTCSFTVTITDNEPPVIVCPGDINQNVDTGIAGAVVTFTDPVGTDNDTGAVTTQIAGPNSGDTFPIGDTIVTFQVEDTSGNIVTCSFTVTITDNEPPVIVCPDNINQTADTGQCEAILSIINPTAIDNCSSTVIFNGTRSDNLSLTDVYPVGLTTITWTATDEANNTSLACIQSINITDDEAPIFVETLPTDTTVECDNVPQQEILTATDNCSIVIVTPSEERIDGKCPSYYQLKRTWTTVDANNNTTIHTQIITVEDTTPPVLSLPANVSAECSDDLTPIAFGSATATDNCDANPIVTFNDVTTNDGCAGSFKITRTWTATDACGNFTTADQTISTSDTTSPEFEQTTLPQDLTVECRSIPDAETLTATDNCGSASVEVNDKRIDGDCPNNYKITRTWTATDDCGLTKTHIQTITVVDITPPTFIETTLPATNLVVECDAVPTAETLTATDTCGSASVTVNDVRTDGNCENNYTIIRTWTATDECGLKTTHTQIITVQDTTPPDFVETSLPQNITVECDNIPTAETLTATDNCGDATVGVKDEITEGDCPNNYIISRIWTATDECGLITIHTQTITVEDTEVPIPASTFDETLNVSCTDIPDAPELEFTDNCSSDSNIIVVFNETNTYVENVFEDYVIERTWTVRDECNNEAVYNQTLNVALDEVIIDMVAPDLCFDEGAVDLNNLTPDELNINGTWELLEEGGSGATLTANIFDPTNIEWDANTVLTGLNYSFRYTTTDEGCINITEIDVVVNYCKVLPCGENDVVISKAVTPNGDVYNEFFEISGIELCGFRYDVKIFNRWGALIYEADDYQNNWNGFAHKSSVGAAGKVPNGTYYYIVNIKDSGLNPITGPVYLGTK